jgi:hypothetical protein
LSFDVFKSLVGITFMSPIAIPSTTDSTTIRTAQWLGLTVRTSWGQRNIAIRSAFDERRWRAAVGIQSFTAVSNDVFILIAAIFVCFALATGSAEEALFAFAAAAHTWRIVRVVDTAKIASYFAPTTGDASLVDTLVLRVLASIGSRLSRSLLRGTLCCIAD